MMRSRIHLQRTSLLARWYIIIALFAVFPLPHSGEASAPQRKLLNSDHSSAEKIRVASHLPAVIASRSDGARLKIELLRFPARRPVEFVVCAKRASDHPYQVIHKETMLEVVQDEKYNYVFSFSETDFPVGTEVFIAVALHILSLDASYGRPEGDEHSCSGPFRDELRFNMAYNDKEQYTWSIWQNPNGAEFSTDDQLFVSSIESAITNAFQNSSRLGSKELDHVGFSGSQFRHFLNNVGAISRPPIRYLECGVFNGSTLLSILKNNEGLSVVAIDSWAPFQGYDMEAIFRFVGREVSEAAGGNRVSIFRDDVWSVFPDQVVASMGGGANVYFYDAGHEATDHFLSLIHYLPALADSFLFIVDDWRWAAVQAGTHTAIEAAQLTVLWHFEMTAMRDSVSSQNRANMLWHNGVGMFVLRKPPHTQTLLP
jgi:hypothetical protein